MTNLINAFRFGGVTGPTILEFMIDVGATDGAITVSYVEAGTFYWAIHPTATPQKSKADIAAGTDAIDYGTIPFTVNAWKMAVIEGLSVVTAYKVHYYAVDASANETSNTISSEFSTLADLQYTPVDDFRVAPDNPSEYAGFGLTQIFT